MNPRTGAPAAVAAVIGLLKDLRSCIQKHDSALIRMDVRQIEEQLVAERSICKKLSEIRAQLEPTPAELVPLLHGLRRILRTHSILIAKSRASAQSLINAHAACSGQYPNRELASARLPFINQEPPLA